MKKVYNAFILWIRSHSLPADLYTAAVLFDQELIEKRVCI